jgi:hypothetical protein
MTSQIQQTRNNVIETWILSVPFGSYEMTAQARVTRTIGSTSRLIREGCKPRINDPHNPKEICTPKRLDGIKAQNWVGFNNLNETSALITTIHQLICGPVSPLAHVLRVYSKETERKRTKDQIESFSLEPFSVSSPVRSSSPLLENLTKKSWRLRLSTDRDETFVI